jgi:hypothetical protein
MGRSITRLSESAAAASNGTIVSDPGRGRNKVFIAEICLQVLCDSCLFHRVGVCKCGVPEEKLIVSYANYARYLLLQ